MTNSSLLIFPTILLPWLAFSQIQPGVDFTKAKADIEIDPIAQSVQGEVVYQFEVRNKSDSLFIDAHDMEFSSVMIDDRRPRFSYDGKRLSIFKRLSAGKSHELRLSYRATPKQALYFLGWEDDVPENNQMWSQGQGKYTSHWLPSFDDMNEKVIFNLCIVFDASYELISNGVPEVLNAEGHRKRHCFTMEHPMSSYLLAIIAGKYKKQSTPSDSGIPLKMFYYPGDSALVEPTYRYTKRIFNYLESEIGVPYPWKEYKQVPVRDFLYAGMENTGCTIFADSYMIDSLAFVDRNYVNVNAHEMAHQWFGNMVTEKDGNHHWLHEGFATYFAYQAEQDIFGSEYLLWKLYEVARQLEYQASRGEGKALTDPGAGSLTFYEKGALALYMLRVEIGEEAFTESIRKFIRTHQFGNVTIEDFMENIKEVTDRPVDMYYQEWLNSPEFQFEDLKNMLAAGSRDLSTFFKLQRELTANSSENEPIIRKYWEASSSVYLKRQIILDYHKSLSVPFLDSVLASGDILVRQAVAVSIGPVPRELKTAFETLLGDPSYRTMEDVLYKLWVHFPEGRQSYLEKTKGIIGLPDKNVRILWLTLAILTRDYLDPVATVQAEEELRSYTAPSYNFEVRQRVFQVMQDVVGFSDANLKDLVNACVHHAWQFRKFAREMMDGQLTDTRQRQRMSQLSKELKGEELRYIQSKLDLK